MPRGRHRHSPPLHRLLPPSAIAGVAVVCAVGPWLFSEPWVLRGLAAGAALTAVVGAVVMRRWDASAGRRVADLARGRASDEWRHEERVAELESDLEESRDLRTKLEQRLRAKRAELAGLRNEHAALLRRYATAETERATALEGRRLLEIETTAPVRELPAAASATGETANGETAPEATTATVQAALAASSAASVLYVKANAALERLARGTRAGTAEDAAPADGPVDGSVDGSAADPVAGDDAAGEAEPEKAVRTPDAAPDASPTGGGSAPAGTAAAAGTGTAAAEAGAAPGSAEATAARTGAGAPGASDSVFGGARSTTQSVAAQPGSSRPGSPQAAEAWAVSTTPATSPRSTAAQTPTAQAGAAQGDVPAGGPAADGSAPDGGPHPDDPAPTPPSGGGAGKRTPAQGGTRQGPSSPGGPGRGAPRPGGAPQAASAAGSTMTSAPPSRSGTRPEGETPGKPEAAGGYERTVATAAPAPARAAESVRGTDAQPDETVRPRSRSASTGVTSPQSTATRPAPGPAHRAASGTDAASAPTTGPTTAPVPARTPETAHVRQRTGAAPSAAPTDTAPADASQADAPRPDTSRGGVSAPENGAPLPRPAGHFTVPTAVAVAPATPARRPAVQGGFDFFGTQSAAEALESVQNEDLADVVGQEALALHKAESEAGFKPAGAESRGVGQVIDLTAHDETEPIDLTHLRSAVS